MIRSLSGVVESLREGMLVLDVNGFGLEVYGSRSVLDAACEGQPLRVQDLRSSPSRGPPSTVSATTTNDGSFGGASSGEEHRGAHGHGPPAVLLRAGAGGGHPGGGRGSSGAGPRGGRQGRSGSASRNFDPSWNASSGASPGMRREPSGWGPLTDALEGLGFSRAEARHALKARRSLDQPDPSEEGLLRLALVRLELGRTPSWLLSGTNSWNPCGALPNRRGGGAALPSTRNSGLLHRPGFPEGQAAHLRVRLPTGGTPGPYPLLRSPRTGQDHPGEHHRPGDGGAASGHHGPRPGAGGGPGGDPSPTFRPTTCSSSTRSIGFR